MTIIKRYQCKQCKVIVLVSYITEGDNNNLCFVCEAVNRNKNVIITECECGCPLYHPESKATKKCSNCRYKESQPVEVFYYRG